MRQIFAIAFVAFSAAAIASGQKQGAIRDPKRIVEQVIRKLDNERIQAQIHADAAALERIYADDFIGVGPSGTVRTKPQVISDFTSGDLRFQSITTDDVRVRVYGYLFASGDVHRGRKSFIISPGEDLLGRIASSWQRQDCRSLSRLHAFH